MSRAGWYSLWIINDGEDDCVARMIGCLWGMLASRGLSPAAVAFFWLALASGFLAASFCEVNEILDRILRLAHLTVLC